MNLAFGIRLRGFAHLTSLPLLAALLFPLDTEAASLPAVPTPLEPVTNVYHGVAVVDNYQWLEDAASPAVRNWTRLQNERTAYYFSELPYRDGIARQLLRLESEESARYSGLQERHGRIFAFRFKPPAQQPVLVFMSSLDSTRTERVVFDPNRYDPKGTTAMDWFVPSLHGRLVAVSLSKGGSEQGTLHFFLADTGQELADQIPRVQYATGGGSAAWSADSSGIFYTRYPHAGERSEADINFYQQVWHHRLGTPLSEDTYQLGKGFPRIAEIELDASKDGRFILASVANGDGGQYEHFVRLPSGRWVQVTRFTDGIKEIKFGPDDALCLRSVEGAPRGKILRLPLRALAMGAARGASPGHLLSEATVIAPQTKGVVEGFAPSERGLYVSEMLGGPSELLCLPRGSFEGQQIPVRPVSTVTGLQSWQDDEAVFGNESYVQPFAWFTWHPGLPRPRRTALFATARASFDDIKVVREFATSKDGTKVPLNILCKKGTRLNGRNPTILYGYGGFDISLTPDFRPARRVWFDAGGVYVVANLRGGGEYGEEWHQAGKLTRKQNVFDDFIAAAEHLIERGYTSPAKLAVEGGSNGGLLMGAFLTQRPELARAVVSYVGIYDMLRVELDPNGQFNTTEYGSVKNPAQFKALYAYSPYHHVRNGVKYPAVLLMTGANDRRVNPAQSRKMAARLQAATASNRPILLRTATSAGHGFGTALSERIAEEADAYAFLFDQLGIKPR
jgi:prolyl oligopeptidase